MTPSSESVYYVMQIMIALRPNSFVCLFELVIYVPVYTVSVMLERFSTIKASQLMFNKTRGKLLANEKNWVSDHLSQCLKFPTMWYVPPAKPQISLRIHAV